MADTDLLFEVRTPLGFLVRVTRVRWELIAQSRGDPEVLLFYKAEAAQRWVCAVAKQADGHAFLVTAYPTDAVKEGVRIWMK
jgi:hypothetical protein